MQGFSRIAASLTSMLRMSSTPTSATQTLINLVDEFDAGDCGENEVRTSASIKEPTRADYLSSNHVSHAVSNIVNNFAKNVSNYPTLDAKKAFNQLRQVFTKVPSLQNFDLEQYIRVKIDATGHVIGRVLSQLTNNSGQWHPVAYFLHKMIPAKTWYKTHDGEFLPIVEAFKTWRHYLKGCKHKVFILIDHNNLCQFMDIKNLSSCQVH